MDTTQVAPSASTATTTTYLRAWPDDLVAELGWPVNSAYTEHCLVSVLGPTATLGLRLLSFELLTGAEEPMPADLEAISRSLGLGSGAGRNSKLSKDLLRLVQFGYLKPFGGAVQGYWVRTHVAPLSQRHLDGAGPRVRQLHDHLMAGKTAR